MRLQVHNHCMKFYKPGEKILELNCGTGTDAVFFAEHGLHVFATDIAGAMLIELQKKIEAKHIEDKISVQQCSFTDLHLLKEKHFNHIYSNFGGLNCAENIGAVISQFKSLLVPGGTVTLVIMPPVCPWEIFSALNGNFKTAFRRLKKNGTGSNVEGIHFKSWYYTPSQLEKYFGSSYKLLALKGLAAFVPPPHHKNFPDKFPFLLRLLCRLDENFSGYFPFNRLADHIILTMKAS